MNRFGKLFIAFVILLVVVTVLVIAHSKPVEQPEGPLHEATSTSSTTAATTSAPSDCPEYVECAPSDNDSHSSANKDADADKDEKLDYSKPIFTTYGTIVCPESMLFASDADHSPDKLIEMFSSIWNRDKKAKALGCEELQEGVPVHASSFNDIMATVSLPGNDGPDLFTMEDELTNKVPGQSDAEKAELAAPHINLTAATYVPPPDGSSPSTARLLLSMPSRTPILKGNVTVASDLEGFGAVICPNADDFSGWIDTSAQGKASPKNSDIGAFLKPYGCSYLPPGTPMVSEGGNSVGSLVIVETKLSDGTMLNGVTFPSMVVQSQQQHDVTEQQALKEQQAAQQAQLEMQQKQQKCYEVIMQPENQQHAMAIKQEEDRHRSIVGSLNLAMRQVDVTKMPGVNPQNVVTQYLTAKQQEEDRHVAAVQREDQRYALAQAAARSQAAKLPKPCSQ